MLEAALTYGTRRWDTRPIMIKNTVVETARLPQPRYGSARTAAKLLGVDQITAARWAAKGRIPATRCGKRCNRNWCVDLDALRRIRFSRAGPVRRAVAAHELGLSQPALVELLKSQVIASKHFVKERPDMMAREDLDEFKLALCRKCTKPKPGAVLIPLAAALRWKSSRRQAEIVRGVSEGRITVYGHGKDSFGDILIERPRRTQAKPKPAPKPITHLTQAMTMQKYRLSQREAKAILRCLGSRQIPRGGMQPVEIPRLERFFQQHTLVRQLAHQHGLLSLQLARALRRRRPDTLLSIAPKVGQEVHSARLVRNRDIPYVHGVARRLAKKLARTQVRSTK
jgi:LmbE family N-acetylglucosaminyl deacetylase